MNLKVKEVITGKVAVIEVGVDATVADVKAAARTPLGLPEQVEMRVEDDVVEDNEALSALNVQAGATVTVCAEGAREYPGFSFTISTWENDGDCHRTQHFNELTLCTAREYALHLGCFKYSNEDIGGTESKLERDLGESYDEDLLPMLVGTWLEDTKWRVLEGVSLTFAPEAATVLNWGSFVVDVPGLEKDTKKRRRKQKSAPEATSAPDASEDTGGFCLTVDSYEGDMDNCQTDTHDDLSLKQVRLYATTLSYCEKFGNQDRSLDDEEETAVIEKIYAALGIEDDADDLMTTLFGTWYEGERWRRVQGAELTRPPDSDLIRHIDYGAFEKEALELHRAAASDDNED